MPDSPRNHSKIRPSLARLAIAMLASLLSGDAFAQSASLGPVLTPIAVSGDPAPDGDGAFGAFSHPTLNRFGHVAFHASLTGTARFQGIFVDRGAGVETVSRTQDPLPDGLGTVFAAGFGRPIALNASSEVAFVANAFGATFSNDQLVLVGAPGQPLRIVSREGDPAPGGNGEFDRFESIGIEDDGEVVFVGRLRNTAATQPDTVGLYRGFGSEDAVIGSLHVLMREGDTLGPGSSIFHSVSTQYASTTNGNVAFRGFLLNTTTNGFTLGLFGHDGVSTQFVSTAGSPSPDGVDGITNYGLPFAGRNGRVASSLFLDGPLSTNSAIAAFGASAATSQVLVREDDPAPGGGVFVTNFGDDHFFAGASSGMGALAFETAVSPSARGLFLDNGLAVFPIRFVGDGAPAGSVLDGEFLDFLTPFATPGGRVAFVGDVVNTTSRGNGVFAWAPNTALQSVARIGQPLLGSTIRSVDWSGNEHTRRGGIAPLNEAGAMVLRVHLDDGRQAIVATNVPEPHFATGVLISMLSLGGTARWRRAAEARRTAGARTIGHGAPRNAGARTTGDGARRTSRARTTGDGACRTAGARTEGDGGAASR